ncbi:hypothetical protein Pelo_3174 [Pelomyxa schiedti]|nr:hypothetical protein Pelo_3174 [Pelomyxa schiedti]
MSSTNPDEALLWSFVERRGSFALIDVAQTHATNTLAVLCTTQSVFPLWVTSTDVTIHRKASGEVVYIVASVFPLWVTSTDVTIHRKASGEVVYIVAVHLPFKGKNSLFKVESTTGTVTQIVSECKHHSRVSSSLFCVGVGDEYQLWDCNNTEHALRSVCITGEGDSDIKQVVGGSGFLFVLRGGNMVSVIEALSGTPVLTFEVSCTLSAIDTKASLL